MDNRQTKPGTAEKILDAAEELFAESGFDGVSLRQITGLAEVELALANYHFGPKESLFRAVVERRAGEINQARSLLLARTAGDRQIEPIIDAFTRPFLEKRLEGGGWKSYSRLIAQISNSPRWTEVVMNNQFDPVAEEFVRCIKRSIPTAKDDDIYWGFHFLLGAMTFTFAETGRIDKLSKGLCRSTELEVIQKKMVPFLAAGFREICT